MTQKQPAYNTLPWMPIYTGDYARQTRELSQAEHGAYLLLTMYYWDTQHPLPADKTQCYRIAIAHNKKERDNVNRILEHYFYLQDNYYQHASLNKLIEKTRSKLDKLRQNGALGGASSALKKRANNYSGQIKQPTQTAKNASGHYFKIVRNGVQQSENQWLAECLANYLGKPHLKTMTLETVLTEHPGAQKIIDTWQQHTMPKRMAAYSYVVRHTHARNELVYALQLLRHDGYGKSIYQQYLSLFQKSVSEENDNEVCFDG